MLLSLNFFITTGNSIYVLLILDIKEQHNGIHIGSITGEIVNGRESKMPTYSVVSKRILPNFQTASS
jgi:hypothetical protein